MFLIHYNFLSSKKKIFDTKLKQLFLDTHKFDSLIEYLNAFKKDINQPILSNLHKSVILTFSKYTQLTLNAMEFLISDIEDKGSQYLKSKLWNFFQSEDDPSNLIVHFNTPNSVDHFMFLSHQMENWLTEFQNENLDILGQKHILFIFYKPSTIELKDIDFTKSDWSYQVIEDLQNSHYKSNMQYLGYSTKDVLDSLQNEDPNRFMKNMFFKSLERLEFNRHCQDIVKNQLIPVLSVGCEEDGDEAYMRIVNCFHMKLKKRIDMGSLENWQDIMFESEGHVSIEDVIIDSTKEYSESLKKMILILKIKDVIPSIVTLEGLPRAFKESFAEILLNKLNEEFKQLE
jgi:hypothetical protein